MGRPQKSTVYKADANPLGDLAKPVRDAAAKLVESAERVRNTIYDFDWSGQARQAAADRADRELTDRETLRQDRHDR